MDDDGSGSARCGTMDDGRCSSGGTDGGRRSGRRHGQWAVQRAAARTMAQSGGRTRCTHACTEGEKTGEAKRKQRQRFWLQRLRGEARQTLGGERPYLCNLSHLSGTHSHVLLHAQAPCGCHRPPSTPELHMALDMVPDGLPPIPIPARGRIRQATIQRFATTHTHALLAPRHTPLSCRSAILVRSPAPVERGRWLMACHSIWRWRVMRGDRAVTRVC